MDILLMLILQIHERERTFHLFLLSLMSLALGDVSVRMVLCGMSEIFLPMFSSRTFMVLRLIFKSFIHLEFIFVYGVSWWSSFIFLHVTVQNSQHRLLKRLFLLHFMLLPPLSNINWPLETYVYFWVLCFVPLVCVLFLCQYQAVLITVAL